MIPALALGGCKSALEIPVVETGWDIYTGGQYRYGPSIIVNKDGSVDAWFAAPGGYHDDGNLKFDADAVMKPVVLGKGMTAAQPVRRNQTVLFGTRDLPESTGEKRIAYVQPVPVGYRL